MEQNEIRTLVRIAKAKNTDICYKDFAEYLDVKEHSFYNWLNGYYKLSNEKARKLIDVVIDLAMD